MFRCLKSSRIADDAAEPTIQDILTMSKRQLVVLCIKLKHTAHEKTQAANTLKFGMDAMRSMSEDARRVNDQFRAEMVERGRLRDRELAALTEEKAVLVRSEEGLRNAVGRQTREIVFLRNEVETIKSEMGSKHHPTDTESTCVEYFTPAILVQNAKTMLDEMEVCLTDPITFELFTDPVTLPTGHTVDRTVMRDLVAHSRGRVRCPVSRSVLPYGTEMPGKNIRLADLTELYTRMKANLDATFLAMGPS